MSITVNGRPSDLAAGTTVAALVADLTTATHGGSGATGTAAVGAAGSGVAVAINDTVVPRGEWATTTLDNGDRVEVLTAVQGG